MTFQDVNMVLITKLPISVILLYCFIFGPKICHFCFLQLRLLVDFVLDILDPWYFVELQPAERSNFFDLPLFVKYCFHI